MNNLDARAAAHQSWANTPNRTARTAAARRSGPGSIDWHLARLPSALDGASDADRAAAAEAARSAYFLRLAAKSAKSRRRAS